MSEVIATKPFLKNRKEKKGQSMYIRMWAIEDQDKLKYIGIKQTIKVSILDFFVDGDGSEASQREIYLIKI